VKLDVLLVFALLQVKDAQKTGRRKEVAESRSCYVWTVVDDTPIKEVVADKLRKVYCAGIKVQN
jgi:hypothetical protein